MKKSISVMLLALGMAAVTPVAFGQFGGLQKLGLGSGGSSSISAEDLVKKYVSGTKNVMGADVLMLQAVGLKDAAAKEELAAKKLTEGATSSSLDDAAKIQTESSKALSDKFTENKVVLSAEGKKKFTQGLVALAKGISDYTGIGGDVKNFKPSPTSVGSAAGAAMYVVKSLPDSSSRLMTTLKHAIAFAKENKIEVPSEATSLL